MYSLTLLWLTLVAAAFVAGRVSGRRSYQRWLRGRCPPGRLDHAESRFFSRQLEDVSFRPRRPR